MRSELLSEDQRQSMSVDDCERLIDERVFNVWQDRWNACEKGRVTYAYIYIKCEICARENEIHAWYAYELFVDRAWKHE